MRIISLQSGSNGNCIYVESGDAAVLLDAGISGKRVQERLALRQLDIGRVQAVIISHDHDDHVRCAGVYHRKFHLPIYVTSATLKAAKDRLALGQLGEVRHFVAGASLRIGDLTVHTIPTPHDGADGVAFVVDDGRRRLGVLTDLGHVFAGLGELVATLDAVLIESNYDQRMLAEGPYPDFVKKRIEGPRGHLSNVESAGLLRQAAGRRMRWACIAHLSQHNNEPALALETHRSIVGSRPPTFLAGRYWATEILEV